MRPLTGCIQQYAATYPETQAMHKLKIPRKTNGAYTTLLTRGQHAAGQYGYVPLGRHLVLFHFLFCLVRTIKIGWLIDWLSMHSCSLYTTLGRNSLSPHLGRAVCRRILSSFNECCWEKSSITSGPFAACQSHKPAQAGCKIVPMMRSQPSLETRPHCRSATASVTAGMDWLSLVSSCFLAELSSPAPKKTLFGHWCGSSVIT